MVKVLVFLDSVYQQQFLKLSKQFLSIRNTCNRDKKSSVKFKYRTKIKWRIQSLKDKNKSVCCEKLIKKSLQQVSRENPFFLRNLQFLNPQNLVLNNQVIQGQEFDEGILKFIRCPISKQNLQYDKEKKTLISDKLGIRYDLKNGVAEITPFNASI
ncbi:hypothetical protein ABPG72_000153 [Tetrahymena utriculariae]